MGKRNFAGVEEKNEFFRTVGEMLEPARESSLRDFNEISKLCRIPAKTKP